MGARVRKSRAISCSLPFHCKAKSWFATYEKQLKATQLVRLQHMYAHYTLKVKSRDCSCKSFWLRETFENWISKAILHDQFDRPNTCVAIKHHRIALTGSGHSLDVINDRRFIFGENFIDIYESSNLDGAQVVQHRWHFTLNSASTLSQTLKHFSLFNMWRMPIEFPTFIRWCDITTKRERWTWRAQVNVKQAIKVDQSRAE